MSKLLEPVLTLDKSSGQFKLVNSSESEITSPEVEGLLIYNGGTVCDDKFNFNSAHAICKQMGFVGSKGWRIGERFSIQQGYRIALDNVECKRDDWSTCSYLSDYHDCDHQEDVFLTCGRLTTTIIDIVDILKFYNLFNTSSFIPSALIILYKTTYNSIFLILHGRVRGMIHLISSVQYDSKTYFSRLRLVQ